MLDTARRTTFLGAHGAAVVGALAAAAGLAWLPFVDSPLSPDEGGFLLVASQWHPGTSLYGDYWVDRPPLLVSLFQLADLGGGAIALRVLGILAVVVSVLLAGRLGRSLALDQPVGAVAAAATAAVFLTTPYFGTGLVNGELLAMPFLLGGLLALTHHRWALAGVLAVAAASVKQSQVDVVIAAAVVLGTVCWRRQWATAARATVAFAAGAAATLGVLLAWAAVHGTYPGELWDAVVTFRGQAAEVISRSASSATSDRAHGVLTSFLVSGAVGLLVVALVPARRRPRDLAPAPYDVRPVAAALVVWEAFVVAAGGSYWLHYLIATVPALVLLTIVLVRHRPERWRFTSGIIAYSGVASVAAVIAVAVTAPSTSSDAATADYLVAHKEPGDTAVIAFGDPALLRASGMRSPYPLIWSLPARVRDPHLGELTRILEGPDRPTWVVVAGESLATWGIDPSTAQPLLDRHYALRQVYGDWHVYHLARED